MRSMPAESVVVHMPAGILRAPPRVLSIRARNTSMSKLLVPALWAMLSISCSCQPGAEGAGAPQATVATDAKAEFILDKAPT